MKQRLSILVILLVVATLSLSVKPAAAIGAITVNVGCGVIDTSGLGFGPVGTFPIFDNTTFNDVGSITLVQNGPDWSGHGTFSANTGDLLDFLGGFSVWTVLPCTTGAGGFNPGDGRVDGKPGDRIAVYCAPGNPPTIYAYGVDDNSHGLYLGFANVPDILKKGSVSKSGHYGMVTFGTFGPNVFTAIWNGPYNAFSNGQFGKKFTCIF